MTLRAVAYLDPERRTVELRGMLGDEHVVVTWPMHDFAEGVSYGWSIAELGLVFRRLDRFARREI